MRQPPRAFSENRYFSSTLVHKQETCEVSRGANQQFVRIRENSSARMVLRTLPLCGAESGNCIDEPFKIMILNGF